MDQTVLRLLIQAHLARLDARRVSGDGWLAAQLRQGYEAEAIRCEVAANIQRHNTEPGALLRGLGGV